MNPEEKKLVYLVGGKTSNVLHFQISENENGSDPIYVGNLGECLNWLQDERHPFIVTGLRRNARRLISRNTGVTLRTDCVYEPQPTSA